MKRRQFAAIAATLVVAGPLGSNAIHAQNRDLAATVILACDHSARTDLATRVRGFETAGRVPESLAAALQVTPSCAEAFNLLALGGFELVHRLARASDANADGDVDGRDFLIWQRGYSPGPARAAVRATTVLVRCDYVAADGLTTKVAGSEIAGAIPPSLAAALAARPSCTAAHAVLAGAGFALVSAAPAPAADGVDASDLAVWRSNFGAGL